MSTVFYNVITVTGDRDAVDAVCSDARRPISGKLRKTVGTGQIDWSFEKLFQLHPALSEVCEEPPRDEWHYLVMRRGEKRVTVHSGRARRGSPILGRARKRSWSIGHITHGAKQTGERRTGNPCSSGHRASPRPYE